MGSHDSLPPGVRDRQLQRIKTVLQTAIFVYVVVYAMFYKNTHLRMEPVTGNVYIDVWPGDLGRDIAAFSGLGYCSNEAAAITRGTCLLAVHASDIRRTGAWGHLDAGESVLAAGEPKVDGMGRMEVPIHPEGFVFMNEVRLCSARDVSEVNLRRCAYVNEIDLFSFKQDNFIPTRVQVVHQTATCVDGSANLETCQLDYKTTPELQRAIDEYFIGAIERYQVQLTHAFQSETLGQRTMAEAEHFGIPDCGASGTEGGSQFCYEYTGGGHDMTTVGGLLGAANLSLASNNDETNHVEHRETYRTSGMKLRVRVRYTNIQPWWSWMGMGSVGYHYDVEALPAQSVWRSLVLRRKEDMRAWVSADKLEGFKEHDRILIWADGIQIDAHVTGSVGHLDMRSLLILLASTVPLMWLTSWIAGCILASGRDKYETMTYEDIEGRSSGGAGAPLSSGEDSARADPL